MGGDGPAPAAYRASRAVSRAGRVALRYTVAMSKIYHITTAAAWAEAQAAGAYSADSLATEGFIHFSTSEQLLWVAERFYRGLAGLLLLTVDTERLTAELRFEESEPGRQFPHLYGPLNLDAVIATQPFTPNRDGSFTLPPGL
jgi:uncharacterized protein (DUF952 family)